MSEQDNIHLFENQKIRTAWDTEEEKWYFSVADVVGALTEHPLPRRKYLLGRFEKTSEERRSRSTACKL